jgi:hypothetical protein
MEYRWVGIDHHWSGFGRRRTASDACASRKLFRNNMYRNVVHDKRTAGEESIDGCSKNSVKN